MTCYNEFALGIMNYSGSYHNHNPLSVITSTGVTSKPPPLSPLCGWQKQETNSPKKISPITPTKRRTKASAAEVGDANPLRRELLPMCFSSNESPTKSDSDHSAGKEDDNLIYMKVPNMTFSDLADWSKRKHCAVTKVDPFRGLAVSKLSGSTVEVNQELIALFRYDQSLFAINEKCPHLGGPLHLGDIEVLPDMVCITCPWHKWKMNLSTGKVLSPLNRSVHAQTYPTQLGEDDSIWIGFENCSAKCFGMLD